MCLRDQRLPRNARLNNSRDFSLVLKKPLQRLRKKGVDILIAPNGLSHARLGVIVGRAYDRRSTRRHMFKRRVREAFRLQRQHMPGLDVVVRARHQVGDAILSKALDDAFSGLAKHPADALLTERPKENPKESQGAARVVLLLLRGYQLFLSPLLGPRCRFYPTCSTFAMQAVRDHGVLHGLRLTARRLVKCHPWHAGGYDPVPPGAQQGS